MARPLRIEFPGALYHITVRGKNNQTIFLDDQDRELFLTLLAREVGQQGWHCDAYCLMGNHFHLLIETPQPTLVTGMRRFNAAYSQSFNRRHQHQGHLFHGRYQSVIVDKHHFRVPLVRYMLLNPVRKHLAKHPEDWRWSSYRMTVGLDERANWLSLMWLRQVDHPRIRAQAKFKRYMAEGADVPSPWDHLQGQIWLGDDHFRARMEHKLQGQAKLPAISRTKLQPDRPDVRALVQEVAQAYRIDPGTLFNRHHQGAFQACTYLLRRVANLPLKNVADITGVSPSRISHIQRKLDVGPRDYELEQLLHRFHVIL